MATAEHFRRIALALEGTSEHPHFDRRAFKVVRTYATLAADGLSANIKFDVDEQALKSMTAPTVFAPVPGGWGRMGWTVMVLANATEDEIEAALTLAWSAARTKRPATRSRRRPG